MSTEDTASKNEAKFVRAGVAILSRGSSVPFDGLNIDEVVAEAGLSKATFRRTFPRQAVFYERVAAALLPTPVSDPDRLRAAVDSCLATNPMRAAATIRSLVDAHFGQLTRSFPRRLLANVLFQKQAPERLRLRDDYARRDALAISVFERAFGRAGAGLRGPLNRRTFPIVLVALIDGLLLRQRADPQSVSEQLLADALTTMLDASVDVGQPFQGLDDALAATAATRAAAGRRPANFRAEVVAAARIVFAERSFFRAELREIARLADITEAQLRAVFSSKEHVIVAALEPRVTELQFAIQDGLRFETDHVIVVTNHLLRLAQLIRTERPFFDAMMAVVVESTHGDPAGMLAIKQRLNLPALLEPAIARGQDDGVFHAEESAADIAATLTNTLVLHIFTRPDADADRDARLIANTTLRGVLVDPIASPTP